MSQIKLLLQNVAKRHDLPQDLVHAIVLTESGGIATRWRVEPRYRYLWDVSKKRPFRALSADEIRSEQAPRDFSTIRGSSVDTEWWGQQASWGLMQIMGAVARERGYTGDFPALCDSLIGLKWGCAHLAHYRDCFYDRHGWAGVVAAYNAGSPRRGTDGRWVNQGYVDKVAANGGQALIYPEGPR